MHFKQDLKGYLPGTSFKSMKANKTEEIIMERNIKETYKIKT